MYIICTCIMHTSTMPTSISLKSTFLCKTIYPLHCTIEKCLLVCTRSHALWINAGNKLQSLSLSKPPGSIPAYARDATKLSVTVLGLAVGGLKKPRCYRGLRVSSVGGFWVLWGKPLNSGLVAGNEIKILIIKFCYQVKSTHAFYTG